MSHAQPDAEAFFARLAEFRNGLPQREQPMMDAVVALGTRPVQGSSAPPEAPDGVPEEEQRAFFLKLERYRDGLPEPDQRLVDAMVVQAGAAEPPDVEAHEVWVLWEKIGHPDSREYYSNKCATEVPVAGWFSLTGTGIKSTLEKDWGSPIPFSSNKLYKCIAARW